MAYSKVNNTSGTNKKDIKYLNRTYNQFKQDLINFSKNYFPDSFNDFSESNPGMIFLELASYVGDVLYRNPSSRNFYRICTRKN